MYHYHHTWTPWTMPNLPYWALSITPVTRSPLWKMSISSLLSLPQYFSVTLHLEWSVIGALPSVKRPTTAEITYIHQIMSQAKINQVPEPCTKVNISGKTYQTLHNDRQAWYPTHHVWKGRQILSIIIFNRSQVAILTGLLVTRVSLELFWVNQGNFTKNSPFNIFKIMQCMTPHVNHQDLLFMINSISITICLMTSSTFTEYLYVWQTWDTNGTLSPKASNLWRNRHWQDRSLEC